jgi:hypothetical protein
VAFADRVDHALELANHARAPSMLAARAPANVISAPWPSARSAP